MGLSLKSPLNYAYPNARVMALKSFMLKDEDIKGLASAKNLEEYVSLLEHTPYKQDLTIAGTDTGKIENALLSGLVAVNRLALGIAPRDTHEFFKAYMSVHEVELLQLILNGFDAPADRKAKDADYSAYGPILSGDMKKFVKEAADAKTKKEAVELLKGTNYDFLSNATTEELNMQGYTSSMLDKRFYENLWNEIEGLSSQDAAYAKKLVGSEIDIVNVMILLRSALCRCKAEKFIISGGFRLGAKVGGLAGKDMQEISSAMSSTYYRDIVSEGLKNYEKDKSLLKLELAFKKHILAEYRRAFLGSPFHIGILLGFLKLKEYEVKNLRAMAVAIDNGLSPKDIMELVIR